MDRRLFILGSIAGLTGLTSSERSETAALRRSGNLEVRIAVLPVSDALRAGITFGLQEAQHAARLFGAAVRLLDFSPEDINRIMAEHFTIVICDDVPPAIERAATDRRVVVFNAGAPVRCAPFVFHLSRVRRPTELAWHRGLERYGAAQLNARYEAAMNAAMDENAWLGWLAIKIGWEATIRARSTDARVLADYLVRDTTVFDGHKGRPLRFDAHTRVLDQPYYDAEDLTTVTETATAKGACEP